MMLQISGAATAKRSGSSQLMPMAPRIPAVELAAAPLAGIARAGGSGNGGGARGGPQRRLSPDLRDVAQTIQFAVPFPIPVPFPLPLPLLFPLEATLSWRRGLAANLQILLRHQLRVDGQGNRNQRGDAQQQQRGQRAANDAVPALQEERKL